MPNPIVSNNDDRIYHCQTLSNGLGCLLVCDPNCKSSAISVAVGEGHFDDPREIEGLAHLLEHTLFLGSKQFPQANYLHQFLSNHGGSINAWTGGQHSNFHFDVSHSHCKEAMAIFADMLCAPLFDKDAIVREIASIDAEFKLKLKDDLRRLYQVHKETCNPAHPFSQFSVGNAETLGSLPIDALQKALISLHADCFVAPNMKLCIISNLSIEEMSELVEVAFARLRPSSKPSRQPLPPLYLPENLAIQINIRPIKVARRLIVSFALPDVHPYYRSKPLEYISHMLGDEGAGSLLVYLKSQNWATNLSAGGGIDGSNFKDFNLNLQLTEEGTSYIERILNAIFYYIDLIRSSVDQSWRVQEQAKLAELGFEFCEPGKQLDEAVHLANQQFHYPTEHLLTGDYLVEDFDRQPLITCLGYMTPNNMRVKFISPEVITDKCARWYATPYSVKPIDPLLLKKLMQPASINELTLAPENPYIMASKSPQPTSEQFSLPRQILTTAHCEMWFGQDNKFLQPKGDIYISFDCEAVTLGPHISAYKRLWVALMMEHINHHYYRAGVAGLHHHLYPHQAGFSLHTSGFSEKQMTLCEDLFNHIQQKHDFSAIFEQIQNKHFNALQNALLNKPINRLFTRLSGIVQRYNHAPSELLPYVKHAKLKDIENAKEQLMASYYLEGFIYGDWSAEKSQQFAANLCGHAANPRHGRKIKRDVANLTQGPAFLHQVDAQHDDAAVVVYFQTPSISHKDIALTILVEQLLAVPFFNTMRTERQLGYLVGSGYLPINRHPGMAFYIQSPTTDSRTLSTQISLYLDQLLSSIEDFEEVWTYVRDSVLKQLNNSDTSLTSKSQRLWMAIGNQDHHFDQQQSLALALTGLEFSDIENFCAAMKSKTRFGKLVLFCSGNFVTKIPEDGQFIYDIQQFKSSTEFMV